MHEITVQQRCIAYHDRGAGPAVVLLHPGFVADGMLPLLDDPGLLGHYRLIAPHRRGYGRSDRAQPPVSVADLARDLFGLLDAIGIERTDLVGHSFGGCLALEAARMQPERIGRVVLLEPPLGFALSQPALAFLMDTVGQAMARFAAGDHAGAVAVWLDGAFGAGWQEPLERAVPGAVAQATRDAPAAFGIDFAALQTWDFGPPDLKALRVPILSVVHQDAWAGFVEVHQALLAAGAQAAELPVGSHLLHVLEPGLVARTVGDFLSAS
jgi:pimeloyl-ACP methyl ester carboxylesterase